MDTNCQTLNRISTTLDDDLKQLDFVEIKTDLLNSILALTEMVKDTVDLKKKERFFMLIQSLSDHIRTVDNLHYKVLCTPVLS